MRAPRRRSGARADVTVFDVHFGAHGLQPGHVDVDRARTDRAAAGQRNVGAAVLRDERPEHQDRSPHGLDELVGREGRVGRGRVDLDPHALVDGDARTHAAEQFDHRRYVMQVRDVCDRDRPVGQQRARQNRQRGVLGARNANFAVERHAAQDLQFVQGTCSRQRGEVGARPSLPLGRGKGLNGQRMNFTSHALAEPGIHHLMTLQRTLALELRGDHDGLEMGVVVRHDARLRARQAVEDHFRDFVCRHGVAAAAWERPGKTDKFKGEEASAVSCRLSRGPPQPARSPAQASQSPSKTRP